MKILLVEDEPATSEMLAKDIMEGFCDTEEVEIIGPAETTRQALSLLKEHEIDLALLDISLGEEKDAGIRLAEIIKKTQHVPTVFLSGLPRYMGGYDTAKLTGPFAYLHKPYEKQHLMDCLELALKYQTPVFLARKTSAKDIIFIRNLPHRITPICLDNIILLEADNKIMNIYLKGRETRFFFTSPGLKNFCQSRLSGFQNFLQINKTFAINMEMVEAIENNHIIMIYPMEGMDEILKKKFPKKIPIPIDKVERKRIFRAFGMK